MATRGIVARATNEGWQGRYAHWDNYPERMVEVLGELVARDGLDKVIQTLITQTPSWSIIDPLTKPSEVGEPSLYEAHTCVTGYGYAHTDVEVSDPSALFTHKDTDLAWADWLYVIHETMLEVRRIVRNENGQEVTVYENAYPWESIAPQEATA